MDYPRARLKTSSLKVEMPKRKAIRAGRLLLRPSVLIVDELAAERLVAN
jgi:hypothetical protein